MAIRFPLGDPRAEKYTGPLKSGQWVTLRDDLLAGPDEFYQVPVGIEEMTGKMARLINLRGEVRDVKADCLTSVPRDSLASSLAAFCLVSVPVQGDKVGLVCPALLSPPTRELFQSGAEMVRLEERGDLQLALVRNKQGQEIELGWGHLKRADLPEQVTSLLQRSHAANCAGTGVGMAGGAAILGGVRLAMRRSREV
ncbi:hypothetical protein DYH09_02175 [bacterium CPR1]|nr:hypothetical protein [bacterium CPR1]